MKMLVTGSTGGVGSAFVERLLAKGHEVRALVRRTSDISHLRATKAEIVFGDITEYDTLPPIVKGIDIVFHCAAKVTPGWGTWAEYEATTVKGTENMLEASAGAGVKRFLQVSSMTVYGVACRKQGFPASENTPCDALKTPERYYDYAKLMAEQACWEYHRQGKIQVSMIRIGSSYGLRDRLLCEKNYINTLSPLVMFPGSRNPRYSVVNSNDIAELAILAATSDKAVGQVYNVAGPDVISLRDFAKAMAEAQGGPKIMVNMPYSLAHFLGGVMEAFAKLRRSRQPPFLTRYYIEQLDEDGLLDGSKARNELGWAPQITLEEGMMQYVQWRRSRGRKE